MNVDMLALLDRLDEFRRNHQNEKQHPSDWCMRVMEALVTADPKSKYSQDLKDLSIRF